MRILKRQKTTAKAPRLDYRIICDLVAPKASVLDLGCGDGELLSLLEQERNAVVQGIEVSTEALLQCVKKGLTVWQGDIEGGLADYPDASFDYIILNQSLQEVRKVDFVLEECLRVGRAVIIGFPNFAHITARFTLFWRGRTPQTSSLPHRWHLTPNVRFLSIEDFEHFCREKALRIVASAYLSGGKVIRWFPNLFARDAIFVIKKNKRG